LSRRGGGPRRWILPLPLSDERVAGLSASLGIPEDVCRVLLRRGIESPDEARAFLKPHLSRVHSPHDLPDMRPAVERVERALAGGERILVHGDYDADGMSGAALLTLGLREIGGDAEAFVPHRTRDGYDLSDVGIARAVELGATLIVTADCGVTAYEAVRTAASKGIDVVITDHHRPGEGLPEAVAVVNPMLRGSRYPFRDLSGVGVAFKLLTALYERAGVDATRLNQHLDLVALGTVADQMPLAGENRVLVRAGLRAMERSRKPGLRSLLSNAGLRPDQRLDAEHISFRLAPRLNSVGRMGEADSGLRLLLATDVQEAQRLADHLERQNSERRLTDARVYEEVKRQLKARLRDEDRAVVLWGDDWHPGVIGIVASRLVEKTHRPSVVISFDGEVGRGSGRSVEGFHLFNALQECESLLERFGGHRMAAGLTVRRDRVEELAERIREMARRDLSERDAVPELQLDLEVPLSRLGRDLLDWLNHLAPFGSGNPQPILVVRGVELDRTSRVGADGGHLRMQLVDDGKRLPAIGFGLGRRLQEARSAGRADVALEIAENTWNGRREVQARVLDFRPIES
jgi:single-stranded-DNA-specific exonuclease